jgi:hypothetical protein
MKPTFHVNGDVKKQYCRFYVTQKPLGTPRAAALFSKGHICAVSSFPIFRPFLLQNEDWMGDGHNRLLQKKGDTCVLNSKSG